MDRQEYENNQLINPKKDIVKSNSKHRDKIETLIQGRNGGIYYNPIVPPLPNNVIKYEASAKLSETTNPESSGLHINAFNTTMVSHTFENGVGTIEFEDNVTILGEWAFAATNITKISIPNSITSINFHAFYYCTGLTSITIPDSITSINDYAFNACGGLTSIKVNANNTVYDSRNNCNAIIETATNTLIRGCQNTVIPNSVTSIGSSAFSYCDSLTSVTIPDSVTSIGNQTFEQCSELVSVTSLSTTAPTIQGTTFHNVKTNGTLTVPTGSTGYDVWMGTGSYYLGKYNWTKVEQ